MLYLCLGCENVLVVLAAGRTEAVYRKSWKAMLNEVKTIKVLNKFKRAKKTMFFSKLIWSKEALYPVLNKYFLQLLCRYI